MQHLEDAHEEHLKEQEEEWRQRCEEETERVRLQRIEVGRSCDDCNPNKGCDLNCIVFSLVFVGGAVASRFGKVAHGGPANPREYPKGSEQESCKPRPKC
eukprot:scaffold4454_cov411-Prasinococcus_capsulatus_cf.AAC.6